MSVEDGNIDLVQLFLEAGMSPNYISNSTGLSPLHLAVYKNDKNLIMALLNKSANVDASGRNDFETPLFIAARAGNVEIVQILFDASTTRSTEWREGYLSMYIAAYYGHDSVVKLLLDKKVDPNANVGNYLTPLHAAAQRGHKKIVELLLERGAKVNAKRSFSTPLLAAASANHIDVVHLLLDNGADVNAQMKKLNLKQFTEYERILIHGSYTIQEIGFNGTLGGYTCLHFATKCRNEELVKSLLRNGANVNFEESTTKATPISFAVENEDEVIVHHLLAAGANTSAKAKYTRIFGIKNLEKNIKLAELLIRHACSSQLTSASGNLTPLGIAVENNLEICVENILKSRSDPNLEHRKKPVIHIAVEQKNMNVIKLLLKYKDKIDLNSITDHEGTALLIAVRKNSPLIVQALLNAGADINVAKSDSYNSSNDENTPLGAAIIQKNVEMIEIILKKRKLVHTLNERSPFRLALRKSNLEVVKTFLKYGAKIDTKDEKGLTPLFHAVDESNLNVVKYLLQKRASLHDVTNEGDLLIHLALTRINCSEEILQLLVDFGVNVNRRNSEDSSPLNILLNKKYDKKTKILAARRQGVLKILLENGANPNVIDTFEGRTMLHLAIERDEPELLKLLLAYGANVNFPNRKGQMPLHEAITRALSELHQYEVAFPANHLTNELNNNKYDEFYINRLSYKYKGLKILPFRESVRLLIQEILRRLVVDKRIHSENKKLISSEYVSEYVKKCRQEIKCTEEVNVCQGINYQDLLKANSRKLVSLARNKTVQKLLSNDRAFILKKFPEFGPMLLERLKMGNERRMLIDSSYELLKKLLPFNWPQFIAEEIFSYLSNRDIRNVKSVLSKDIFI